ncbi:DUF2206 domain-containing protein [Methanobacterium sp.]|uniref:DUF2206 domain-containing protein n=1 Tax=Methanobacterium sp. TaxID=2164 RepID=UPI002AB9C2BA|nr:DUF2206 domain-containing protein [Methanobacterium sp.]MDY9923100.1 DUF2206 domain-containing protein [Methanobacterium sp.]
MIESTLTKIKNFNRNGWVLSILIALLVTDLIIILNLDLLKQAIPFIFFTIIPGMLIVNILRLHKMEFLKKFVLSVGLSISLLIFTGFLLNSLYPFIPKPLALEPVLIALNLEVALLALLDYHRSQQSFSMGDIFNFKLNPESGLLAPLIFPFIFPILAILGTYLMNNHQNNLILIVMLFLIPAYLVVIFYLKDRINPLTYPVSLWLIGLGLLLMHGLTSNHIIGRDVHAEYYCFQLTLSNLHWDINSYYNPYNACLDITILPTLYQVISNISSEYVFKLYYTLIGSVIPLLVYLVSKKYFKIQYAFCAGLLFTFQIFFINLTGAVRQEIAILFFFLAVMVLFNDYLEKLVQRKVLFLIFILSLIMSHYTTSYVALGLLVPILLLPFFKGLVKDRKLNFKNFDLILIYLLFLAVWFLIYAKVQFNAAGDVMAATAGVAGGGGAGIGGGRDALVLSVLGIGLKSLPNTISAIVNDAVFLMMGIGLFAIFRERKKYRDILGDKFILGILLSITILALFIIVPGVSFFYGADRLFFQLLIFTAPLFVIGVMKSSKIIKKPHLKPAIFLVLLISLFVVGNHLQYHFYGIPYSSEYDSTGSIRGELFIYDQEVVASKWLGNYSDTDLKIYADSIGGSRLMLGNIDIYRARGINFDKNKTIPDYLYLGYVGTHDGKVYETLDVISDWFNFDFLFQGKSRIYDNYYSEVYL